MSYFNIGYGSIEKHTFFHFGMPYFIMKVSCITELLKSDKNLSLLYFFCDISR